MKNSNKSEANTLVKWGVGAVLTIASMGSAYAYGDNDKIITKDIQIKNAQQLHLDAHVGSVKFSPSSDDQIHVYVKVSDKEGWGIFKDSPQDAQLVVQREGNKLTLSLNDDEYGEEWRIELPQMSLLNADLGVGEIQVKRINTNLKLDVGVGEATIVASASAYSSANGQAGVGAAAVRSVSGTTTSDRAMVSEEVNWSGSGEYSIDVEVGVGDISIKLD